MRFDLDQLCRLASSHGKPEAKKCVRVIKQEGNFNKALVLTRDDGSEVIAKIPCPNAGPPLVTASEVATLEFCAFIYLLVKFMLMIDSTDSDVD